MEEGNLTKICAQCGQEKPLLSQFYRAKNGKDGYMKMCIACYKANLAESRERVRIWREEWQRKKQEEARREAEKQREEEETRRAAYEEQRQRQEAFLQEWYARQEPRKCIACQQIKPAIEFGYSIMIQEKGFLIPNTLHQRCKPCHEKYREKSQVPCVLCQQPIGNALRHCGKYATWGGGTKINLCCWECMPAFQALPEGKQRFYIRSRVNLAFPSPQVIYALIDPHTDEIRYIGRTGHAKRRHKEHHRDVYPGSSQWQYYDEETQTYVMKEWYTRGNWIYDLQQQGLEAKQRILLDVQPAGYVVEYERRYILHAVQQGWPIVNTEAVAPKKIHASSLDFLHAPLEALIDEGWFSEDGMVAFIRAWC